MEAKVRKVGNNLGVLLPKQLIEELHLQSGDKISIERKGSHFEIRPIDPDLEVWVDAYHQLNIEYKDVLKELAE